MTKDGPKRIAAMIACLLGEIQMCSGQPPLSEVHYDALALLADAITDEFAGRCWLHDDNDSASKAAFARADKEKGDK